MKINWFLLLLFCSVNCDPVLAQSTDSLPKVLVVNGYDPSSTSFRKNKKELLADVADSLRYYLMEKMEGANMGKVSLAEQRVVNLGDSSGWLDSLLLQKQVSFVIVILNVEAEFVQTDVDVERQDDGSKKRTARYDLCTTFNYLLAGKAGSFIERKEIFCEFFTERTVMSGLLAAGPDLVGKSKWVFRSARKNAAAYFDYIRSSLQ
ncbi:MAG TPA: hypothetical protein PLO99_15275 [Chitinophagaceae bacterium]|nr:hypothetical protein [Chitinophagaceae bacterium]